MKGGILHSLFRPFITTINATQPACHGPVIPPNLFSTTSHAVNPLINDKPSVTQKTDSTKATPTGVNETLDSMNKAPSDKPETAQTTVQAVVQTEVLTQAPIDPSTIIESAGIVDNNEAQRDNNNFSFDATVSEKAIAKNKEKSEKNILPSNDSSLSGALNEVLLPVETKTVTPKKRSRRKNEVTGTDVLQNWDKPLLMRLRPNRAAGYDKNDHAIDHPRFKLVKTNGRSHFEKADATKETTALSKRRKPRL